MDEDMFAAIGAVGVMGVFLLVIAIVILYPMALIWSVNTLFFNPEHNMAAIPYTFWTWLSMLLVAGMFAKPAYNYTKKN